MSWDGEELTPANFWGYAEFHGAPLVDFEPKECTFLQWTGLNDTNGVDIYEGDILRHIDWGQPQRMVGIVIWQVTEWVVKRSKRARTWVPVTQLANGNCDHWEVIGNIYEHPELLQEAPA